jgi:hypothetical protein
MWANYFGKVTGNLQNHYKHASQVVSESFLVKDAKLVAESLHDLVNGSGKENEGSFLRKFDERDKELESLEMEDLTCSRIELDDWINVKNNCTDVKKEEKKE